MTQKLVLSEKIKAYWNTRANAYSNRLAVSTEDIHLKALELATLRHTLRRCGLPDKAHILDLGCGNGLSTISLANACPRSYRFLGVDYAKNMIRSALEELKRHPHLKHRVLFQTGDVMALDKVFPSASFDLILTDRCLINLPSNRIQAQALSVTARLIKKGGYYLAIENFIEGQKNMNEARRAVDLPRIPVRWHNFYLKEKIFCQWARPWFKNVAFSNFASSYYFATRVIYAKLCHMRGEEPCYNHPIHQWAKDLPHFGDFSPVKMAVLKKR